MKTLYDLGIGIQKIRDAIDSLTLQGSTNASYVVYAVNQCNEIIFEINRLSAEMQNSQTENPEQKEGNKDEQPDTGITE